MIPRLTRSGVLSVIAGAAMALAAIPQRFLRL